MQREPLLYLAHRIPFPPNKGDKVRSFNILRHLSGRYRVFLGCFVDQAGDVQHAGALGEWCEQCFAVSLNPTWARIAGLRGLATGEALTIPYYRNRRMARWVQDTVRKAGIDRAVIFSGAMAQYLGGLTLGSRVVDFCDVDSAKWAEFADRRRWPMSWLYRREGRLLSEFERWWAEDVEVSTFVTESERALFLRGVRSGRPRVEVLENGVDEHFFDPRSAPANPYPAGTRAIVFSGAMDYWPNVDAACWFAAEVMPLLRDRVPGLRFVIVGMNPAPAVRALAARADVEVTGTVPDVRPFVTHASVVVAPLRIARGIQNKVLEAMSLGRPVVVSRASASGLGARPDEEFLCAGTADEFARAVLQLLDPVVGERFGAAARRRILGDYAWQAKLAKLDAMVESGFALRAGPAHGLGGIVAAGSGVTNG